MFVFLTALKSAAVCDDWGAHSRLVEASLRSVFAQTDGNFRVVVVCHEEPELCTRFDERLEFRRVDYAPPTPASFDERAGVADKFRKLRVALTAARHFNPNYVMLRDADDLVHRDLVRFVHESGHPNGWLVEHGFVAPLGSPWLFSRARFWQLCGTSSILNARLAGLAGGSDGTEDDCVLLDFGHHELPIELERRGQPLANIPFPAAVYRTRHGDNNSHGRGPHWARSLIMRSQWKLFFRDLGARRWATRGLRQQFGL
ncbi:MAG: glycosyltransferase family A protein [Pseudomonadota bacterium]